MGTLYRGISEDQKKYLYAELYEIFHSNTVNFRFRMPHEFQKLAEEFKKTGISEKGLNMIIEYDGTLETCSMIRKLIEVVRRYW